jgi:hypothetical protein
MTNCGPEIQQTGGAKKVHGKKVAKKVQKKTVKKTTKKVAKKK